MSIDMHRVVSDVLMPASLIKEREALMAQAAPIEAALATLVPVNSRRLRIETLKYFTSARPDAVYIFAGEARDVTAAKDAILKNKPKGIGSRTYLQIEIEKEGIQVERIFHHHLNDAFNKVSLSRKFVAAKDINDGSVLGIVEQAVIYLANRGLVLKAPDSAPDEWQARSGAVARVAGTPAQYNAK